MSTRQQSEVASETRSGSKARQMLKLSVEVRCGTARFRVAAQARSIREALGMVKGRYPEDEVKVAFQ